MLHNDVRTQEALSKWLTSEQGCCIANNFATELVRLKNTLIGRSALQIGGETRQWLDNLQFDHKWTLGAVAGGKNQVVSSLYKMPFPRNSLDCVIAPLTINLSPRPLVFLDEMDRVLSSMGYAVFLGINPYSFWAVAARFGKMRGFSKGMLNIVSPFWLQQMLLQRGYEQLKLDTFYFVPPFQKRSVIKKLQLLNAIGNLLWPFPAGFYYLVAQKKQFSVLNPQTVRSPFQKATPYAVPL